MTRYSDLLEMLTLVSHALGAELLQEVAFLGGCTTGLLITDEASREAVRYTEDVDLITHVIGYPEWLVFQSLLSERGFVVSPQDDTLCRMRLGELKVDFMPDDASILGFSNRWYADAFNEAQDFTLADGTTIRLVSACHFIATKLEAYLGRGNNDPLSSHDIEDMINVIDGREKLLNEVAVADVALRTYLSQQLALLMQHPSFDYVVQSACRNSIDREEMLKLRLQKIIEIKNH
jgi:predicted nucleotidyltransferase